MFSYFKVSMGIGNYIPTYLQNFLFCVGQKHRENWQNRSKIRDFQPETELSKTEKQYEHQNVFLAETIKIQKAPFSKIG